MRQIHFLLIFLSISFVIGGLSEAVSDNNPVISHARPGFGMLPRAGAWSKVTVRISNPGDSKEVEVVIPCESPGVGSERVLCRRPVYLPRGSMRGEKFYVLLGEGKDFEVRLYHKEIRIGRDTFPMRPIEPEAFVFLVISETSGSCAFFKKLKVPGLNDSPIPVYSRPQDLPEKWVGYDGIDVVILGSFRQGDLNGHQAEALKQWVAAGGTLIISSGGRYNQYRNSFVEEILDMRILGTRAVTGLPSMEKHFESELKIDEDFFLTEVHPGSSKVILQEGEVPLILASDYGSGKVFFLGFDISHESIRRWGGVSDLLAGLLGAQGGLFPEKRTALADKIEAVLVDVVGVSVPEFGHVAAFLLSYLGVVVFTFVVFRFRKRPELAWLVYPVAVPVSILIAYQMGQVGKGEVELSVSEVSLTELSPGLGWGMSRGYLGFFSPGGLTTSITFNEPTSYGPRASRAIPARPPFRVIEVYQEDGFTLKDLTLNAGALQTLRFNNLASLGEGIDSRMMLTENGLLGQITNRTGQRLDGCLLVYNRYIKPIGLLDNGQTAEVQMADPDYSSGPRHYSSTAIKTRQDVVRERIISSLFSAPIAEEPVRPGLVFFGWVSQPVFDFGTTDFDKEKDILGLVMMKVPIEVDRADEVLIPKGICDMEPVGAQLLFFRGEWRRSHYENDATVDFIVPDFCRKMTAREIQIYFEFETTDMKVSLEVYNWEEERWVRLEAERQITLPGAQPYIADGKLRMKVEGRRAREMPADTVYTGFWQVRDLDVEIRGSLKK